MANIYYSPEEFGCELVANCDVCPPDYSFDYATVWREKATGNYFYGEDSGCSCPFPYENITSLADLQRIEGIKTVEARLRERLGDLHAEALAFLDIPVATNKQLEKERREILKRSAGALCGSGDRGISAKDASRLVAIQCEQDRRGAK